MRMKIICLSIGVFILNGIGVVFADGVPDFQRSWAEMLSCTASPVSVCNVPDGSGYPLTQARAFDTPPGSWQNATITVTLIDPTGASGNPLHAYPLEDMWLENHPPVPPTIPGAPAGLVACPLGVLADADTDVNGQTTFTGPFHAGGHVTYDSTTDLGDLTYVMVGGEALTTSLELLFNSPDIDGDGVWSSGVDVILFSQRYPVGAGYSYSVDFHFDEVNDLSDLVLFSAARNSSCP